MAENFQKAIEDLTQEEAQAEVRRAWEEWRQMDDLCDQARAWAIAANSLRADALEAQELVKILGRSLTECSAPKQDVGGLIRNRRMLALLRLQERRGSE